MSLWDRVTDLGFNCWRMPKDLILHGSHILLFFLLCLAYFHLWIPYYLLMNLLPCVSGIYRQLS